jgi:hypothetical protein
MEEHEAPGDHVAARHGRFMSASRRLAVTTALVVGVAAGGAGAAYAATGHSTTTHSTAAHSTTAKAKTSTHKCP